MNEGQPGNPRYEELMRIWEQDKSHPKRGPIIKMVQTVKHTASMHDLDDPLSLDTVKVHMTFPDQFGDVTWTAEQKMREAKRYRLYHFIIGGTPEGDLFDTEGENSIATRYQKLAEKYHIRIDGV